MPELPGARTPLPLASAHTAPELERAAALVRSLADGKIVHVDSYEDELVYSRLTHHEFVRLSLASRLGYTA